MKRPSPALICCLVGGVALTAKLALSDEIEDKFRQFDRNGDGQISGDEFNGEAYLPKLDLNHDGILTLEESRNALALWQKMQGQRKNQPAATAGEESGEPGARLARLFKRLDKNADGKLDASELPQSAWREKLDADSDGNVTLAEAQQKVELIFRGGQDPGETPPPPPAALDKNLSEGPQLLKATDLGVGHQVPDFKLTTVDKKDLKLSDHKKSKGIVLAYFSATCPISGKMGLELARIEKECAAANVTFLLVNPIPTESSEDIKAFTAKYQITAPVVHDQSLALSQALHATVTTEVFLLDAARTLTYRGAISDQYGLGYQLDAPRRNFLRDALAALQLGEAPPVAATSAPGCALDLGKPQSPATPVALTYHRDISRILQANCVECHRADGLAPFSLETHADVIKNAGMMKKQVGRGAMPPWFAAPSHGQGSLWSNDRSLAPQDKADLLAWLNSNRPLGDVADAPLPRKFAKGWVIGEPDAVFQLGKPITIKAEGTMPYQNVTVPTDFAEDRWVQSYEIIPTDRAVVHHVIVKVVEKGKTGEKNEDRAEREGYYAAYVPGNSYRMLPEGFAKKLPAGATLHFQIHYTPNGKATEDQLKIGFKFAKNPPQYEVKVSAVAQPRLNIPPNEANHLETAQQKLPWDLMATAFMAHMHVRGKAFKYEVTYPDGKQEVILDIPRYDFNWQLAYNLAQPKLIPRGSTIKVSAVFDNSSGNPANPDPSKTVRWGQQTFDEMMIGYVEHYVPYTGPKVAAR
ncbi:MAG: redoxin domain-containing protein [Verrucomicrobium sp.]